MTSLKLKHVIPVVFHFLSILSKFISQFQIIYSKFEILPLYDCLTAVNNGLILKYPLGAL